MTLLEEDALAYGNGAQLAIELSLADTHLFHRETGIVLT
jgi:hypothetical protein